MTRIRLDPAERDAVRILLMGDIVKFTAPHDWLKNRVSVLFAEKFPYSDLLDPRLAVKNVLDICESDGFSTDPPFILELLSTFVDQAMVRVICDRIEDEARAFRQAAASAPDPFDDQLLWLAQPFMDREPTRSFLSSMHKPAGIRVLVVKGKPRSGKTYTYTLIQHAQVMSHETNPFDIAYAQVKSECMPSEILSELGHDLNMSIRCAKPMPNPLSEAHKWAGEISRWLVDGVIASGKPWWIVLDGVDLVDPELRTGVEEFVKNLVEWISKQSVNIPLRLVVLGFRDDFDRSLRHIVKEDLLSVTRPGDTDVRACLQWIIDHDMGELIDLDSNQSSVDDFAKNVMDRRTADYANEDMLSGLCFAFEDILHAE